MSRERFYRRLKRKEKDVVFIYYKNNNRNNALITHYEEINRKKKIIKTDRTIGIIFKRNRAILTSHATIKN